ncbi:MAG: FAD-binding oxidoreductase [Myxococcota bacterium]
MTELTGWGSNLYAVCDLVLPETPVGIARLVEPRGTIARGLGRSYGDAAINEGGRVIGMTGLDRYLRFDEATGTLECEAGVSLAEIIATYAPRGWFPSVTPGTRFVTIGGCIANDVHGKGHHSQGSFSSCVESMTVMIANGEIVFASREQNADLFWATFGGMGLLGLVLTAKIRLLRIETTYFRQSASAHGSLEQLMAAIQEQEHEPYAVATIDVFATGARLGRGVLNAGDHARLDELPAHLAKAPLRVAGPPRLSVPFRLPDFTLTRLSVRLVNALILEIQRRGGPFAHYDKFIYPLDFIAHWNRGYGRRGFTQYQFIVPSDDATKTMRKILTTIQDSGELPFLNILKRMGAASGGLLSFPTDGYTLAVDFPIRPGLEALLRKLDAIVVDVGGRIYLGKDSFVQKQTFQTMYPSFERWLQIKKKYDPEGVFTSNLARRVGLVPSSLLR